MSRNSTHKRLSTEERARIRLDLGADNSERAGSDESHNRRYAVRSSIHLSHIPPRNTQAADGTTFTGFPSNRLDTNAADDRVIQSHATDDNQRGVIRNAIKNEAVNVEKLANTLGGINAKIPDNEIHLNKTTGTIRDSQLPNIPGSKIPNLSAGKVTSGRFNKRRLPSDVAYKNDLPDTRSFAKKTDLNQKTGPSDVVRLIKKHVKKGSLNK